MGTLERLGSAYEPPFVRSQKCSDVDSIIAFFIYSKTQKGRYFSNWFRTMMVRVDKGKAKLE